MHSFVGWQLTSLAVRIVNKKHHATRLYLDLTGELINDIKFRKFLGLCVHSPIAPQGDAEIAKRLRGDAVYAMLSLRLWLSCQINKTDL